MFVLVHWLYVKINRETCPRLQHFLQSSDSQFVTFDPYGNQDSPLGRVKKHFLWKIQVHMMFSHDVYQCKHTQKIIGPKSPIFRLLWDFDSVKGIIKEKACKKWFWFFIFPFSDYQRNLSGFETLGSSCLIWYPYCYTLWHFMTIINVIKCQLMSFYDFYDGHILSKTIAIWISN